MDSIRILWVIAPYIILITWFFLIIFTLPFFPLYSSKNGIVLRFLKHPQENYILLLKKIIYKGDDIIAWNRCQLLANRLILVKLIGISVLFVRGTKLVYHGLFIKKSMEYIYENHLTLNPTLFINNYDKVSVRAGVKHMTPIQRIDGHTIITHDKYIVIKTSYPLIENGINLVHRKMQIINAYANIDIKIDRIKIVILSREIPFNKITKFLFYSLKTNNIRIYYSNDIKRIMYRNIITISNSCGYYHDDGNVDYYFPHKKQYLIKFKTIDYDEGIKSYWVDGKVYIDVDLRKKEYNIQFFHKDLELGLEIGSIYQADSTPITALSFDGKTYDSSLYDKKEIFDFIETSIENKQIMIKLLIKHTNIISFLKKYYTRVVKTP